MLHFVALLRFAPILLGSDPLGFYPKKDHVYNHPGRVGIISYPSKPRTCHHFTPPTTVLACSSPPNACMRYGAALSQDDIGIVSLTMRVQGGDGVCMFENAEAGQRSQD